MKSILLGWRELELLALADLDLVLEEVAVARR